MVLRSRFPSIWTAASVSITADLTATLAAVTLSADATVADATVGFMTSIQAKQRLALGLYVREKAAISLNSMSKSIG